ncbi:MAG: hypothetical protein IJ745_07815 [Bacteroidales bacterium]|nr:hypothetical protein [Bacteroidales bacterium]
MTGVAAGVMLLVACGKEHQCKCVTTDVPDDGTLKVLVMDGSISCDDIKEMAFEEHVTSGGGNRLRTVDVHQVECRSYGE